MNATSACLLGAVRREWRWPCASWSMMVIPWWNSRKTARNCRGQPNLLSMPHSNEYRAAEQATLSPYCLVTKAHASVKCEQMAQIQSHVLLSLWLLMPLSKIKMQLKIHFTRMYNINSTLIQIKR